VEGA
jgi:voltage-dependent anion channel protein 2